MRFVATLGILEGMYTLAGLGALTLPADAAFYDALQYEKAKELRAQLSEPERRRMLQAAADALPECYGERLENCIHGKWDPSVSFGPERCLALSKGYVADWDVFQGLVEKLDYCDEIKPLKSALIGAALGGALGLAIGLIVR